MKCSTRNAKSDKRKDMALVRGLMFFSGAILFFSTNALPQDSAQDSSSFSQPRSFLREASALIPQIDMDQRSSAASNIAGQQARIGDLESALATSQLAGSPWAQVLAAGSIAYSLASQGNLQLALEVIQNSSKGEDPAKANEYGSVALWLAEHHDFEHALQVARLIQRAKSYFGQTNHFVGTLLPIGAEQFKVGDRAGAQETIDEALAAVEWEKDHPQGPRFDESMTAGLYANVAAELAREGNRPASVAVVDRIYYLLAAASTEQAKQDLLLCLGEAQVGIGELDAAIATAEQLPPGNHRDAIVLQVGFERAKAGDLSSALDDATALLYEPWRNISLRDVAARFSAQGNNAQALATLDLIPEPAERAEGLADLALQEAEKQDPSAPLAVELAYEAAVNAGAETKPYVFEKIAVTRAILGDFGAAEEMIVTMDDASKVWPLWNVTEMLIRGGREAEAISLAENQSAPWPKAYALLGVATALINKQQEAAHYYLNSSP
jgi:thioesterase domain-containing protein